MRIYFEGMRDFFAGKKGMEGLAVSACHLTVEYFPIERQFVRLLGRQCIVYIVHNHTMNLMPDTDT